MQRFTLALFFILASAHVRAADLFTVLSGDDLIRKGLSLELDYVNPDSDLLAFQLTAKRGGDRFTIPCRVLGSFVDNKNRRDGYQRAHCQVVKYRNKKKNQYEVLTVLLDKLWSKPTESGRKSNAYKISVDLVREYARRGDDIQKFRKEAHILFGSNFDDKTVEGAKTRLKSKTGRSVAESPIRLMNQIEQALTPLAQKGTLMYSEEVERSVRAWGFTYHLGEDFTASISGRWGSYGRSEAGVKTDLNLLAEDGYSFASKTTLTERVETILRNSVIKLQTIH